MHIKSVSQTVTQNLNCVKNYKTLQAEHIMEVTLYAQQWKKEIY